MTGSADGAKTAVIAQDSGRWPSGLRGHHRTDATGRYDYITVIPGPYTIPLDGPTGKMTAAADWSPWRPAHIHLIVSADGYEPLVTQLFIDTSDYLDNDVASAVKPELIGKRIAEIKEAGVLVAGSLTPQKVRDHYEAALEAGLDILVIQGTVVSAEHVSTVVEPLNLKEFCAELPVPVIVGGCASYQAALHLMRTGAAGVLVGVGPGAACTTRGVLGVPGMNYSLLLTREHVEHGGFILLDGDVVFDVGVVEELVDRGPDCLAVRSVGEIGLEEVKVTADNQDRVLAIGKHVPVRSAMGESVGIELFSAASSKRLFGALHQRVRDQGLVNEYYEAAFQQIIDEG
jgi:hypothetical protein